MSYQYKMVKSTIYSILIDKTSSIVLSINVQFMDTINALPEYTCIRLHLYYVQGQQRKQSPFAQHST